MAKSKTTTAVETQEQTSEPITPISAEDSPLIQRIVMDVTGCGQVEAARRVTAMDSKLGTKILELEAKNERSKIVALLY